jgi:hypothetical protein
MSSTKTLNEIRKESTDALAKALGPVGIVGFLQSFDTGGGDYTKERCEWLDGSVEDIMREIGKANE